VSQEYSPELRAAMESLQHLDDRLVSRPDRDLHWRDITGLDADASSADRSTVGGPALHGSSTHPQRSAPGSSGFAGTSDAAEAVRDLLSLPQTEVNWVAQMAVDSRQAAEERVLIEAYRRGEQAALGGSAIDPTCAGRALAPHGLTVTQVVAAVRNILETGHPDAAAPLLWAVRDYVPTSQGRRKLRRGTDG